MAVSGRGLVIKFGTSGWRAVIADEFTYANVRLVAVAIGNYLKEQGIEGQGVVVGYDTRFMSDLFGKQAGAVLTKEGIPVAYSVRDVPTPVIAFTVIDRRAAGAINITASHNPPQYNGIKFSPASGAPAPPEVTQAIEAEINKLQLQGVEVSPVDPVKELFSEADFASAYLRDLESKIASPVLIASPQKVAYNALWGTGRGYVDRILRDAGWRVDVMHGDLNPLFGGKRPEPSEEEMGDFLEMVKDGGYALGLATDGDADRFGVVDKGGRFICANHVLALVAQYLIEDKGIVGGLVRSVATTHLLDRIAEKYGRPLYETPVGFKFVGRYILEDKAVLGGEESAGLSIKGHVPEKDGVLACLLVAEMVANRGTTLSRLLDDLFSLVGALHSRRINIPLTPQLKKDLPRRLAAHPSVIAGRRVTDVIDIDGIKMVLEDGSWLLFRPSGTEPLVRIYVEADSQNLLDILEAEGRRLIGG